MFCYFARLSRAVHPSPGFTRTPLLIQPPLARLAGVRVSLSWCHRRFHRRIFVTSEGSWRG